jgi:hypothetical protein
MGAARLFGKRNRPRIRQNGRIFGASLVPTSRGAGLTTPVNTGGMVPLPTGTKKHGPKMGNNGMTGDPNLKPDRETAKAGYGTTPNARRLDIPVRGLDTPYGLLYRPRAPWQQILVLFVAFFGGPGIAWLVAGIIGDLSETATTLLYVPYVLIFFGGYALWIARLNVIAYDGIGRSLLKALFLLIVFRRKPASVEEVLPGWDKLLEMLVRAQKAGASFAVVGWPIGLGAGVGAMVFDSARDAGTLFFVVAVSCVLWAYVLAYWGRRGWLPFAEED